MDKTRTTRIRRGSDFLQESQAQEHRFQSGERHIEEKEKLLCSGQRQPNERRVQERSRDLEVERRITELRMKEEEYNWKLETIHRAIAERQEFYNNLQRAIQQREHELAQKDHNLCLIVDIIRERQQELEAKDLSFHQAYANFLRLEDQVRVLTNKVAQRNEELRTKEEELDVVRRMISDKGNENIKAMRARINQLLREVDSLKCFVDKTSSDLGNKEKDFQAIKKKLEGRVRELESKEKQFEGMEKDLKLKEARHLEEFENKEKRLEGQRKDLEFKMKQFEEKKKQLELKETWFEGQVKELKSKENRFKEQMKDLEFKMKQLEGKQKVFESKEKEFEGKHKVFELKEARFEEQVKELESKEKQFEGQLKELQSKQKHYESQVSELQSKQKHYESQVSELQSKQKHYESQVKELQSKQKHYESQVKELQSKQKHYESQVKELQSKQKQFEGLVHAHELKEKQFKGRVKELESNEKQYEGRVKELESNEKQYEGRVKELESNEKRYERKVRELGSREKQYEIRVKELESNEKHYANGVKKLVSNEKQYVGRVLELETKEKQFEIQRKGLESNEKQYARRVKELVSNEKQYLGRMHELVSKEKQFEIQRKGLESKEKQIEGQMMDLESKKIQHEGQVKELESKEAQFKVQLKELESREKRIKEQMEDLESKMTQYEGQVKELELKETQFKKQVKELKSNEKAFEGEVKDSESKQKQSEAFRKSFEKEKVSKQKSNGFLHQVNTDQQYFTDANSSNNSASFNQRHFTDANNSKNLDLFIDLLEKYELVCSQVSDSLQTFANPTKLVLDTIKGFYTSHSRQELIEYGATISRRICNLLMDELKKSSPVIGIHAKQEAMKLASDWKANIVVGDKDCLEVLDFFKFVATYEIGSSFDAIELQRLLDIIALQYHTLRALGKIEESPDNQSSSSTDGRDFELLQIEHTNDPEIGDNFLVKLQMSSDPAKLVLDIIQNPIVLQNKGSEGVIIHKSDIFLLEQLMTISPQVKPCVREEALKLALDLKANIRGSAENSLTIVGFLLVLSNYGLVSDFNEHEVLKLLESVAQHKLAVELFRTLGFVDKITDFVQNLIEKQQHIVAVRFVCAYKLADKIPPVDVLRQHMAKAKSTTERFIGKKKSIDQKVNARDEEIASLKTVLQCISDNNLESQDLVKEIEYRIVDLERQKDNIVRSASGPSSKKFEEKTVPAIDEAVTVNKVKVQKRGAGVFLPINNQWGKISKRRRTAVTHPRSSPPIL